MIRLIGIECVKQRFGSYFIKCYRLPSFEEIKQVIDDSIEKFKDHSCHYFCALYKLIAIFDRIQERKDDLIYLSNGKFFGKFEDHLHVSGFIFSTDDCCAKFFEMFMDPGFTPEMSHENDVIWEWSLYVVQFEESDEVRVKAVLELFEEVRNYIQSVVTDRMKKTNKDDDDDDDDVIEGTLKKSTTLDSQNEKPDGDDDYDESKFKPDSFVEKIEEVNYCDTKSCTCDEYEASGDCSCIFDL